MTWGSANSLSVGTIDLMKKGLRRQALIIKGLTLCVGTSELMKKGLRRQALIIKGLPFCVGTIDLMKKGLRLASLTASLYSISLERLT